MSYTMKIKRSQRKREKKELYCDNAHLFCIIPNLIFFIFVTFLCYWACLPSLHGIFIRSFWEILKIISDEDSTKASPLQSLEMNILLLPHVISFFRNMNFKWKKFFNKQNCKYILIVQTADYCEKSDKIIN